MTIAIGEVCIARSFLFGMSHLVWGRVKICGCLVGQLFARCMVSEMHDSLGDVAAQSCSALCALRVDQVCE